MPCIRRVYNYGKYYMSPEIKNGRVPLCGQTVETIEGNSMHAMPFIGFMEFDKIEQILGGVVTHISGYTAGVHLMDEWIDYNQYDWFLGHCVASGVYLVTQNNLPIKIGFGKIEIYPPMRDNVSYLSI
jgi:hypothetical protein